MVLGLCSSTTYNKTIRVNSWDTKRKGKRIMEKTQFEKDLEIKESFIDLLNDVYPTVKIGYSTFTPAEILECCDPVAFAIGLVEHEDYLAEMENE
jgi:hypothetical protein